MGMLKNNDGWRNDQSPVGREKTGPDLTDRDKGGVKRSVLTEAHGIPLSVVIDGANRHDLKLVKATLEALKLDRPEPDIRSPQGLCLDKGYDDDEVRDLVAAFGLTAHIRGRGEEGQRLEREAGTRARTVG